MVTPQTVLTTDTFFSRPITPNLIPLLESTFPNGWSVWQRQSGWARIEKDESAPVDAGLAPDSDLRSHFEDAVKRGRAVTTTDRVGRLIAVFPLEAEGEWPRVGVGSCSSDWGELLSRVLKLQQTVERQQHQLIEQDHHLADYARHVTADLEELTWLRCLAENLEFCNVTHPLEFVAQAVLPSLRELVSAEWLALVSDSSSDDNPWQLDGFSRRTVISSSQRTISEASLRGLVNQFRSDTPGLPVVRNNLSEQVDAKTFVSNLVIVPVARNGLSFGWIVALNRSVHLGDATGLSPYRSDIFSESEFGTAEATLLSSAATMLATHACNVDLYQQQEGLIVNVVRALINAIDARDHYTCGHSDRVAMMSRRLAEQLGADTGDCERIYLTGLLHDIGKIGLPDRVLLKPGRLNEEEFDLVKQHPLIGYRILKHLDQLKYVLPGVLHHHESVDGGGYPDGLTGEAIPFDARILAVVDAYDAMTSQRPYRDSMSSQKAESILRDGAGQQWDETIVSAFLSAIEDMRVICSTSGRSRDSLEDEEILLPNSDSIVAAVLANRKE